MSRKLCACGFANREDAEACVACGEPLEAASQRVDGHPAQPDGGRTNEVPYDYFSMLAADVPESTLTLTCLSSFAVAPIAIAAPGGVLGRGGDFVPEVFSPRVSRTHARVVFEGGKWSIEHLGRNRTRIRRAGTWIELPSGRSVALLDGDQIALADMLFSATIAFPRVSREGGASCSDVAGRERGRSCAESSADAAQGGTADESTTTETTAAWAITCPVCGSRFEVDGPDAHIGECDVCVDALDKRKIAAVPAIRERA